MSIGKMTCLLSLKLISVEEGTMSLDELTLEIARKLEQMSREGSFKIHEKGIISDMVGIRVDA